MSKALEQETWPPSVIDLSSVRATSGSNRHTAPVVSILAKERDFVGPEETVQTVAKRFLGDRELQAVTVVSHKQPVGIVYRHHIMDIFLTTFGRDLHGKKPISRFMDREPLIVEHHHPIPVASQYIIANMRLPAVQDFIITKDGEYFGMGTLLDLLASMTSLQINQLKEENGRLSAELEVTHRLQQMLLPKAHELDQIEGLDIAGFLQPADEVGGDYYDVLHHEGRVKIGIGDVTGHGLESGVVALMVQSAIRTLLVHGESDCVNYLSSLNRVIFDNVERMQCDKSLTLALIDYELGRLRISGQHEHVILVRADSGKIELIDTKELGFPIGLDDDIGAFIDKEEIQLHSHDVVVLYTDGITEAQNANKQQYGKERLCEVISRCYQLSVEEIKQAIVADVQHYIGDQKLMDDITLLVLKQKPYNNNEISNVAFSPENMLMEPMVQQKIHGNFKEVLPPTYEYLRLSFSPHPGVSLQERWGNSLLSARFLGDYFATFLPGGVDDKETKRKRDSIRGATTYVANELLENAVKNNGGTEDCFIDLGVHLYADSVILTVTNSGKADSFEGLHTFIDNFTRLGPQKMLEETLLTIDPDVNGGSRLGIVTMVCNFDVELGWKFEPIPESQDMIKVTTMAQLPL